MVALIPPDRLEWAPREGAWSFGDLVRHLGAIERWMFAENVSGRPSRYPGHGRELADGYDAVLAYFDGMHEEAMDLFRALAPEALQARCTTPGGASHARVEVAARHGGARDPPPRPDLPDAGDDRRPHAPLYGLTSEEVKARSTPA